MEVEYKSLLIEKEEVSALVFPQEEILVSPTDIKKRKMQLDAAIALGNIEHAKVIIVFQDEEGLKRVKTTIWAVTDKEIVLKQGVTIPIQRIRKIELI